MAVKIIRHGKPPEVQPIEVTCRNCDTLFSFTRSDASFVPDQRDGDHLTLHCPLCGRVCTTSATPAPRPSRKPCTTCGGDCGQC